MWGDGMTETEGFGEVACAPSSSCHISRVIKSETKATKHEISTESPVNHFAFPFQLQKMRFANTVGLCQHGSEPVSSPLCTSTKPEEAEYKTTAQPRPWLG